MCDTTDYKECSVQKDVNTTYSDSTTQNKPVEYNYVADLENEYHNTMAQLKATEEDRDCKGETLAMIEALVLGKGSDDMKKEMVVRACEIFKKYNS